ncbi:MAG TPA: hypothetical protein PKG48_00205 [Bacteroidales bacterium]|nr:hypothetical protein [Bacteroidales bacterium]
MQSRRLKNLVSTLFLVVILASCSSDMIIPDPPAPPAPPISPNENQISFAGEIQPIFTAKCAFCHGIGQTPPVLKEGKSYQSLTSIPGMIDTVVPANSTLYKEMTTGGGMAQYANKANADSVYKWIRQGAKNN